MAHSERSKYYETERPNIQLSHSDFMVQPDVNLYGDDLSGVLEYLLSIENKYKTWLESKHNKMDRRFCNELFNDVYHQFQSQSPVIIIDQITNFFQIDYKLFYQNLDVSTKNLLYRNLKQRINCDTFIRIKQREMKQQTGGCIQPSFKK